MLKRVFAMTGAIAMAAGLLAGSLPTSAARAGGSAHDFSFNTPGGAPLPLSDYAGQVLLVVNTATACGFRGQIGDLQELHARFADRGLVVLGVPSNDFGNQEPKSNSEIEGYCEAKYGAQFQMTEKTAVSGSAAHPFYKWAASEFGLQARPYWNFHKYLIGPAGDPVAWFATPVNPTSDQIVREIEAQLARVAAPAAVN
ncbi:glutathione peroxidase [Roseibium aquae]|uniref:Glutathione peroxidase n=1 Tax=Roseibium aquae TaxID=1323746 RepID=A0A916TFG6_9HYPH|nr:glutathione peroxidase [Roseibium aquae]GGB42880.1 glutathione peroxidase [Roseibium aquae]